MIKNIVLDVGMVLVDWDWEGLFRYLGYDEEEVLWDLAHYTVLSKRWLEWDRSIKSDEQLLDEMLMVAPIYENEITNIIDHIGEAVQPYRYTKPWIRELKDAGYKVYILSNYSRDLYNKTIEEELDFLPLTDGALFSWQCHYIKPEPEIYETLFKQFDLEPKECVFLDDRQENLDAAEKFGMKTILFEDYEEASEKLSQLLQSEGL